MAMRWSFFFLVKVRARKIFIYYSTMKVENHTVQKKSYQFS